jgi:hypothetical protein
VDSANQSFTSIDGVLFNSDATTLIQYPLGKSGALYSIPAGVISIGKEAFFYATSLTSITIPASVTSIGYYAFTSASALKDVYIQGNAPSVGVGAFANNAGGATAHIKAGATGFASDGQNWNGLVVSEERYTVTYNAAGGSEVSSGTFTPIAAIQTAPASTRTGYTLLGWSTTAGNAEDIVTFPYGLGVTQDITLHAIWRFDTEFKCSTGLAPAVGDNSATYTVTNGVLTNGSDCVGAVVIADSVTSLVNFEFGGAWTLTSITIPAGVTSIGRYAFGTLTSLTSIEVDSANQSFKSIDGVLFNKAATELVHYPTGRIGKAYTIPVGVKTIGEAAFPSTSLASITIPDGVTSIGKNTFGYATSLTSLILPASLTTLGDGAFYGARVLKDFHFLGNAPTVETYTFQEVASSAKAHIKVGAQGFGSDGQNWNGLIVEDDSHVVTYNSVSGSEVNAGTFSTGDTIQSAPVSTRAGHTLLGWSESSAGDLVTFPYTVTTDITLYAIWRFDTEFKCSTGLVPAVGDDSTTYTIRNGVVTAGRNCVGAVVIPDGVTGIGAGAFTFAGGLTSITLPASVTSIGSGAFGSTALTSITIPAGVERIGYAAFAFAASLKAVYFLGSAPGSIVSNSFFGVATGAKAYISATATGFGTESTWNDLVVMRPYGPGSSTGYVNCTQGSQITGSIVIVDFVVIQNNGCSGEVTIPASVTGIAANAFQNASTLSSIYFLGKAPTTVAAGAFSGVSANATVYKTKSARFKLVDGKWNGLSVENAVVAKFYGNGSKVGTVPSAIMRPAGQSFVAPENTGGLGKTGYTFLGWNTLANGRGTSYAPGAVIEMRQAGMTLHPTWSQSPTKADTASKPVISGFTISTSNGKNSLGVTSGPWSGFPKPVLSYQWYSCTDKVSSFGSTVPETCSVIESATSSKLALTKRFKEKHIVVSVTGQSAGTSPTVWFSKSTAAIR